MSGSYMYGTECPICHSKSPTARYLSHESRYSYCGNHTRQEISDWESQPEVPQSLRAGKMTTVLPSRSGTIRVKKMKSINDDDLAMGFAILALCYMLWLATDFILQYGGGWIG